MTELQKMRVRDWVKKYDIMILTLSFLVLSTTLIVLEHKGII
tara:strand:- start:100 stop:225 length:126 start_codon:yes stop_codon:yes gene_type:complete